MAPRFAATQRWRTTTDCWQRAAPTTTPIRRATCGLARRRCPSTTGSGFAPPAGGMPDASAPLVQLRGISKDYHALRPLRIRELDLDAGQSVALVGLDAMAAEVLVSVITGAT